MMGFLQDDIKRAPDDPSELAELIEGRARLKNKTNGPWLEGLDRHSIVEVGDIEGEKLASFIRFFRRVFHFRLSFSFASCHRG